MNKILKIAIIVVLCLIVILTITLFACQNSGNPSDTCTEHKDENKDYICDVCKAELEKPACTEHKDENKDEKCDVCGVTVEKPICTDHKDDNKDYICDICESELEKPACTEHKDENKDEKCDVCGVTVEKPACTEHKDDDKNGKCDECDATIEDKPADPGEFIATNDKVYVITDSLTVRTSPESKDDSNIAGWAKVDNELSRLGYYANGWSKITYNGKECYVDSECLTTSKPITSFTTVNETVYFIHSALAFTKPSHIEDYSVADFSFFEGEEVKRTGVATVKYVAEDGKKYTFARIEFTVTDNGESKTITRYVNNEYLSTTKPSDPSLDAGISFTANSDILVVKEETGTMKIRKSAIYVEGSNEEIAYIVPVGTELQAVAKGTESDGTIWYKVQYEDGIYYVIYQSKDKATGEYKAPYFTIKTPSNEQ